MKKSRNVIDRNLNALTRISVYVVLIGIFIIAAPEVFLGYRIYVAFLSTIPFTLVMALGLTFVVIAGELDLSFPGVLCFSSFVFAFTLINTGNSMLAVLATLISGTIMGFINGVIITKTKIPSIITTLGTQFVWMGLALILSKASMFSMGFARELLVFKIFAGKIGGVLPPQSLWAFGLAILLGLILNKHRFGETILLVGDNREAARMMGINTDKVIIQVFGLMGLLSAFAGMSLTLEMAGWWPTYGPGYLLEAIAAVFIGGTATHGGEGTILGTVIGTFIIGSMTAGIVAAGVGAFWVKFVQGLVLLGAVLLNLVLKKREA